MSAMEEEVVGEVNDGEDGGDEVNGGEDGGGDEGEERSNEEDPCVDEVAKVTVAVESEQAKVTLEERKSNGVGENGKTDEEDEDCEDGSEDGEVFEVESILKERSRKGVKEYLVRWKGYGEEQDTWEPSSNLNCEDAMEKFRKQREEEQSQKRGRPKSGGGGVKRSISKEDEVSQPPKKRRRPKGSGGGGAKKEQTKKMKRSREDSEEEEDDEAPLVIRCKTIFKKHLIENALKFENRRTSEDNNNPDPKVRYFMRYDIDTGEVFVGDVKIEVDEVKKELVCSSCGKNYSEERSWEDKLENPNKKPLALWHIMREMKLHVIGFHLGGFTCPHCDEEEAFHTRGSTHFYRHMSTKHRDILDAQRSNTDVE